MRTHLSTAGKCVGIILFLFASKMHVVHWREETAVSVAYIICRDVGGMIFAFSLIKYLVLYIVRRGSCLVQTGLGCQGVGFEFFYFYF